MKKYACLVVLGLWGVTGALNACGADNEDIGDLDAGDAGDAGKDGTSTTGDATVDAAPDVVEAGADADADATITGGRTLDGGACGGDPVALTSVVPEFAWKDAPTALTLIGTGFIATPKVYLRGGDGTITQLQHVAFVSSTSMTAVVPAGTVVAGTYEVAVVNGNTCAGTSAAALRVVTDPPPSILDVAPAAGTTQNDVPVTITGCHFAPTATLSSVSATAVLTPMAVTTTSCTGANDVRCNNTPLCTMTGSIKTKSAPLTVGAYLVRVTNPTGNTFGEYSTFVVTNPAGNLDAWIASPGLNVGRRSHGVVAGRVDAATRFLYAIGGENAAGAPLKSVEVGPLDRFGQLGAWFVQANQLNHARSGAAVARSGSWIYVIGGTETTNGTGGATPAGTPLTSIERAKILDPASAPELKDPPDVATTTGTLAKGTWYYRVSAVGGDPEDPGGESLASVEVVANLSAPGKVTLSWKPIAGATEYRIYRSATADAVSDTEAFLTTSGTATTAVDGGAMVTFVDDGTAKPDAAAPAATTGFLRPGSTGKWGEVSNVLGTVGRFNAAAAVAKDPTGKPFLYVSGGWGQCAAGAAAKALLSCVDVAPVNADGSLGAFIAGGAIANPRMRHGIDVMSRENSKGFEDAGASTASFLVVSGGKGPSKLGQDTNVEYAAVPTGGVNSAFANPGPSFSNERDGSQVLIANGYVYAFYGGSVGVGNTNYSGTADQGKLATVTTTTLTLDNWNNAGANLPNKLGRHGMAAESAYFYRVGGTTDDKDAITTVERILH